MNAESILFSLLSSALEEVMPRNFMRSISINEGLYFKDRKILDRVDYLFAVGKSAVHMAEVLLEHWTPRKGGLIVSPMCKDLPVECVEGDHPIPGKKSFEAGRRLVEVFSSMKKDDRYVFLLSGGASSLVEVPGEGFSEEEIAEIYKKLLSSPLTIREVNCVRKAISSIKGGKLASFTKAKGVVFLISDVLFDDLDVVGSGLLYGDLCPEKVRKRLLSKFGLPITPRGRVTGIPHYVLANNLTALKAMEKRGKELSLPVEIVTPYLRGEAREVGKVLSSIAEFYPPKILLFGGECYVTLTNGGLGGRNQELVLASLLERRRPFALLAFSTDGKDGNSPYAGAYILPEDEAEEDFVKYLEEHNTSVLLEKLNRVIFTGPTGTNVADIFILLPNSLIDRLRDSRVKFGKRFKESDPI